MRGYLCDELGEWAGLGHPTARGGVNGPPCDTGTCPGPRHVGGRAHAMAEESGLALPLLLQDFGAWLFPRLARAFPAFLVGVESTFDLVTSYETHVAAELRSLDASAHPPELTVARREARGLDVVYRSPAGLADMACGLLRGSVAWFDESLDVRRADARSSTTDAVFLLRSRSPDGASSRFPRPERALRPPSPL